MSATTVELNPGTGGAKELHDSLTTVNGAAAPADSVAQVIKLAFGAASDAQMVSDADPMPVAGPLTDAQLRAEDVAVTLSATQVDTLLHTLSDIAQALGPLLTARSPADGMLRVNVNGNNAVTMYRYSRSGNTWTTMAPTTARAAAPGTGGTLSWIDKSGDANWALETDIKDGRYIYSFRGGASAVVDRFDIAGGTAGAGAWLAVSYPGATETFTTGSAGATYGRYIYLRKDATHRYFKFSVRGNYLEPLSVNLYTDGTAVLGNKCWVHDYDGTGTILWLYSLMNTGTVLQRLPLF